MSRDAHVSRRALLRGAVGASCVPMFPSLELLGALVEHNALRFGLVTYLWGRDLSLETLLAICAQAHVGGIELRTTHAHAVEPTLGAESRREIRRKIEESGVILVGLGSNERFDSPDQAKVRSAIDATKRFLQLSADLGGGGVKVKPDRFHEDVDRERTISQIAASLREVGKTADDLGQEVRLEVHGGCAKPSVIKAIMEETDMESVRVCWNSNAQDLRSPGFDTNFDLLRPFFGDTLHVRQLERKDYPTAHLIRRLEETGWGGWVLLEAHSEPGPIERRVQDLRTQRTYFNGMVKAAAKDLAKRQLPIRTQKTEGGIEVYVGDELFSGTRVTEYGPVIFPICAPGGAQVVRGYPFEENPGESKDHPHHRSCWLAHGDVNGHDFWHDPNAKVVLVSEKAAQESETAAVIQWDAEWRVGDEVLVEEKRVMRFTATPSSRRIEFMIELVPAGGKTVTFGDTKEGSFALRLAPSLKVDGGALARGRLENADGLMGRSVWGQPADWVMAEGPLDGRLVRVTMRDHPENVRYPTWWHARTYGLLAANPFGRQAFQGAHAPSGAIELSEETPLRLRYVIDIAAF